MDIGLLTLGDLLPDPATGKKLTPAARHRQIVDLGVRAEEMGFDLFSVGEHHLCDYVLSAPPVVLAAVAARTERIRLSTGVTLIGSLDPLRVAEDYATLDAISNGRVEVVVGRGIVRRTYRDLGYDPEQSHALFAEHVEALLEFWTKDKSDWPSRGLQAVTAQPRPEQKPHPPVWVGSASENSIDRAASLGLPLMLPTVIRPLQDFQPVVDRYREKFKPSVHGSQPRVGAVSYAHIAPNSDEARRRWDAASDGLPRLGDATCLSLGVRSTSGPTCSPRKYRPSKTSVPFRCAGAPMRSSTKRIGSAEHSTSTSSSRCSTKAGCRRLSSTNPSNDSPKR